MKAPQISVSLESVTGRLTALIWGFTFILLFRYSLNTLYPFWSGEIRLSLFGVLFALLLWVAFLFNLRFNLSGQRGGWSFALIVFLNTVIFLYIIYTFSESKYQYWFPLLFSLQVVIQFFLFGTKLSFFLYYRLSLLMGILPGVLFIRELQNPWVIFSAVAVLSFLPGHLLKKTEVKLPHSSVQMLPLRQSIDFARFLLLALALHGILDQFRDRFYLSVSILVIGSLLQFIILKVHRRKEHIRYGILYLGVIFAAGAVMFYAMPLTYWTASGYAVLALWESVYFQRTVEGYIKRERMIITVIFLIAAAFYFIELPWIILTAGFIFILIQLRILLYIRKKTRQSAQLIFLASLVLWGVLIFVKYGESLTSDFFTMPRKIRPAADFHSPHLLFRTSTEEIKTNLYPQKVIREYNRQRPQSRIRPLYSSPPGALLTTALLLNHDLEYLLSLPVPYHRNPGRNLLDSFQKAYRAHTADLRHLQKPAGSSDTPNRENTETREIEPGADLFTFASIYREYAEKNENYTLALQITEYMLKIFTDRPALLKKAALLSGATGDIESQIDYLLAYREQSEPEADNIETATILMELYLLTDDPEESREWAEYLLREDSQNAIKYYRFIYRTLIGNADKYDWQKFYYRFRRWQPTQNNLSLREEKSVLLRQIEEKIAANPDWYEIFNEELELQETIQFPE